MDLESRIDIAEDNISTLNDLSNPIMNSLDAWGVEINGLKNSFTEDGKYNKVIASVDLGTLNWDYAGGAFQSYDLYGLVTNREGYLKCDKYQITGVKSAVSMPDKSLHYRTLPSNDGSIRVKDTSYTDAATFKMAMNGVILYYELATYVNQTVMVATNDEISKINENVTTLGYSGKNLLKHTATTTTTNGVTFTVNSDGSITATGIATANAWINIATSSDKKYIGCILSGCPKGGFVNISIDGPKGTYSLYAARSSYTQYDTGDGVVLTDWTITGYNDVHIVVMVYSGYDCGSGVTFKPMIRPASIIDDTYEPYKGSVDERLNTINTNLNATNYMSTLPSDTTLSDYAETLFNLYGNNKSYTINLGSYNNLDGGIFNPGYGVANIYVRNSNDIVIILNITGNKDLSMNYYKKTKVNGTWTSWYKFTGTAV